MECKIMELIEKKDSKEIIIDGVKYEVKEFEKEPEYIKGYRFIKILVKEIK